MGKKYLTVTSIILQRWKVTSLFLLIALRLFFFLFPANIGFAIFLLPHDTNSWLSLRQSTKNKNISRPLLRSWSSVARCSILHSLSILWFFLKVNIFVRVTRLVDCNLWKFESNIFFKLTWRMLTPTAWYSRHLFPSSLQNALGLNVVPISTKCSLWSD